MKNNEQLLVGNEQDELSATVPSHVSSAHVLLCYVMFCFVLFCFAFCFLFFCYKHGYHVLSQNIENVIILVSSMVMPNMVR